MIIQPHGGLPGPEFHVQPVIEPARTFRIEMRALHAHPGALRGLFEDAQRAFFFMAGAGVAHAQAESFELFATMRLER